MSQLCISLNQFLCIKSNLLCQCQLKNNIRINKIKQNKQFKNINKTINSSSSSNINSTNKKKLLELKLQNNKFKCNNHSTKQGSFKLNNLSQLKGDLKVHRDRYQKNNSNNKNSKEWLQPSSIIYRVINSNNYSNSNSHLKAQR